MTAGREERRISISLPVRFALIQQTAVLVISALILDGGDVFRLTIAAALLAWVPYLMIVLRRGRHQAGDFSRLDSAVIKYGFWVFFLGMCLLYRYNVLPNEFYHFK
jgi:hypothetical protein